MGAYHLKLAYLGVLALSCGSTDKDNKSNNDKSTSTTSSSSSNTTSSTSDPSTNGTNGTGGAGANSSTTAGMGAGGDTTSGDNNAGAAGEPGAAGTGGSQESPMEGPIDIVEDCGFTACGGELAGSSWQYARVCVEEGALFGGLTQLCEAIELGDVTGTVSGTLTFDQTTYTEDVTVSITASLTIPASCGLANCTIAQALAIAAGLTGTACTNTGAGNCECTAPITIARDTTGDYTTSSTELTRDDQVGAYCASQNSLAFTASQQDVELLYELTPW